MGTQKNYLDDTVIIVLAVEVLLYNVSTTIFLIYIKQVNFTDKTAPGKKRRTRQEIAAQRRRGKYY